MQKRSHPWTTRRILIIASLICVALAAAVATLGLVSFRTLAACYALVETKYAPGYTKKTFDSIAIGTSQSEVLRRLGKPLHRSRITGVVQIEDFSGLPYEVYIYAADADDPSAEKVVVLDAEGNVVQHYTEFVGKATITSFASRDEVLASLGRPVAVEAVDGESYEAFFYSEPGFSGHYFQRIIIFDGQGAVVKKIRKLWVD